MNLLPHRISSRLLRLALAIPVVSMSLEASAASSSKSRLPIVRDAEIEALIADYTGPILKAAGLSRSGIKIVLMNSPDFNAFVAGRRIFVNTGAITATTTPNQLTGILAHETGHLAGNHQERLRDQLERSKTIAIVASLLGAGVAVAGAASGSGGTTGAGASLMTGGTGLATRGLLSYQRGEEANADRSALTYLQKTGQSGKGLLQTFETLDRNNLFSRSPANNYLSSHPLPRERIAALEAAAQDSPYYNKNDAAALVERHDLARAKIAAYSGGAEAVRRLFPRTPRGLPAMYGDAIATYLDGSPTNALRKIDALIAQRPKSPWFYEMRGEILMDNGQAGAAAEAFTKADQLDSSGSGILKAEIGQAIVTGGNPKDMPRAVAMIRAGLQADPENSAAYRFLAMAYGKMNDIGRAELATAEGYWHGGAFKEAKVFAARAQQKLKPGTPAWRQAQDIITTKMR